jgi:hypothetical protein
MGKSIVKLLAKRLVFAAWLIQIESKDRHIGPQAVFA